MIERAYADAPEYGAIYISLTWAYWLAGRMDEARRFGPLLIKRCPEMSTSSQVRDVPFRIESRLVEVARVLRGVGVPE
ncbi:MAG: hypothetical protein ACOH2H_26315 [Cypionkella sp.]